MGASGFAPRLVRPTTPACVMGTSNLARLMRSTKDDVQDPEGEEDQEDRQESDHETQDAQGCASRSIEEIDQETAHTEEDRQRPERQAKLRAAGVLSKVARRRWAFHLRLAFRRGRHVGWPRAIRTIRRALAGRRPPPPRRPPAGGR